MDIILIIHFNVAFWKWLLFLKAFISKDLYINYVHVVVHYRTQI